MALTLRQHALYFIHQRTLDLVLRRGSSAKQDDVQGSRALCIVCAITQQVKILVLAAIRHGRCEFDAAGLAQCAAQQIAQALLRRRSGVVTVRSHARQPVCFNRAGQQAAQVRIALGQREALLQPVRAAGGVSGQQQARQNDVEGNSGGIQMNPARGIFACLLAVPFNGSKLGGGGERNAGQLRCRAEHQAQQALQRAGLEESAFPARQVFQPEPAQIHAGQGAGRQHCRTQVQNVGGTLRALRSGKNQPVAAKARQTCIQR